MRMLGAWLRDWRASTGATQRRVAALAGIDQAHLCRIEQGKRRPSGAPLGRIIIALDWLSNGEPETGPWARTGDPAPGRAARWGVGRPPAVVGREPLPPLLDWEPLPLPDLAAGQVVPGDPNQAVPDDPGPMGSAASC